MVKFIVKIYNQRLVTYQTLSNLSELVQYTVCTCSANISSIEYYQYTFFSHVSFICASIVYLV